LQQYSQEANPQRQISKDPTEKRVAWTVACHRSGIKGYALCDHSHRQTFSEGNTLASLTTYGLQHMITYGRTYFEPKAFL
jgi:hypothetical protein